MTFAKSKLRDVNFWQLDPKLYAWYNRVSRKGVWIVPGFKLIALNSVTEEILEVIDCPENLLTALAKMISQKYSGELVKIELEWEPVRDWSKA